MCSHLDCCRAGCDPAGERVRPTAPDPGPDPDLLGALALDGERPFDDHHYLVDPVPLAQRLALDAVFIYLAADRAADSLPGHGAALSHQPGRCRRYQLALALLRK